MCLGHKYNLTFVERLAVRRLIFYCSDHFHSIMVVVIERVVSLFWVSPCVERFD